MSKKSNLVPVLLLAGFAGVLLFARARQARAGGVTGTTPAATTVTTGDSGRANAVGQIVSGVLGYLNRATGGVTGPTYDGNHSNAPTTPAALDQVIEAAQAWQNAYGANAGVSGDPYNPE